jgi:hypothetical protein
VSALSEANASAVVEAGKDYLFALKNEHRTIFRLATELIDPHDVAAHKTEVLDNQTTVTRTLALLPVDPSYSYGDGKGAEGVGLETRQHVPARRNRPVQDGLIGS